MFLLRSNTVPFAADGCNDIFHIFLADSQTFGFHHNTDQRFRAGLPDQNSAGISQLGGNFGNSGLDIRICLSNGLIRDLDVLQNLGIDRETFAQLAQGLLPGLHNFRNLETGEDALTGGGILGEDDMTGLLAAQTAAVLHHIFVNIFVTDFGFGIFDTQFVKCLVQTEVAHNRSDNGIHQQLATFLHIPAVDVKNMVSGDNIALFVHAQAAVSIAVVGKADIQSVIHHETLQNLDMGIP